MFIVNSVPCLIKPNSELFQWCHKSLEPVLTRHREQMTQNENKNVPLGKKEFVVHILMYSPPKPKNTKNKLNDIDT